MKLVDLYFPKVKNEISVADSYSFTQNNQGKLRMNRRDWDDDGGLYDDVEST